MKLEFEPPGLDRLVLERAVARLLHEEPATAAVVVTGSYAKGSADESSDLDLRAATSGPVRQPYRMWAEKRAGRPLHVSAGAKTIEEWNSARSRPAGWSLGFPAVYDARYLWATAAARELLGDPENHHPPAPPELEDFVEHTVKVRRAARLGDALGARWSSQAAATLAPALLRSLNPERSVRDRRDALDAALTLPVAPEGYRERMLVCLGIAPASDEDVVEAAVGLARSLLAFLREQNPDVDSQPEIGDCLADGTLERWLE